jgi:hypothetical protein
LPLTAASQKTDVGVLLGAANYLGDLAPDLVINETRPAGGIFVRNRLSKFFALKHSLIYGRIKGDDANFEFNKLRNLSFRSDIFEVSSVVEFNYVPFGTEILTEKFTTYAFLGISLFRHNPKTLFNGRWMPLKPIGTEGQGLPGGKDYGLWQVAIPFGMGCKYNLSDNWMIGGEIGFRRTYTDYLDDVSTRYPDFSAVGSPQVMLISDRSGEVNGGKSLASPGDARGNPATKDWYIIAGLTLAYRIIPPKACNNNFY